MVCLDWTGSCSAQLFGLILTKIGQFREAVEMKRIAVLTSGGDAAGMNAAIRAVVRTGLDREWEVFGVRHGFAGLMAGDFAPLGARDVGGIIQHGGTALGSARCPEFKTEEARREALDQLRRRNISALVVIGGDGSQKGSDALSQMGFPVVGVASTIDNDLYGSEITIGVDTALNIALEAIVIPEVETDPELIAAELRSAYDRGKAHAVVVVAEGAEYNAEGLARYFKEHRERLGFDLRVTILGHIQRGGAPGVFDRLLATRFGAAATELLARGEHGVLVGLIKGEIAATPLDEVVTNRKKLDPGLFELARVLAK